MANQQLVDYIKENLAGNVSIEHIKKSLLGVGWPEHEINEAIRAVKDHPEDKKMPLPREKYGKTSILAILSLIFAFLFPPIGLILGIIALSEIKKNPSLKGRGLAIAGIIISIFFIMTYLILFFIAYSAISGYLSPSSYLPSRCELPMGLSCNEFSIVSGNPGLISLTLKNEMGNGIMIRNIKITDNINNNYDCYIDLKTDSPGGPNTYQGLAGWHLANSEEETVKLVCPIKQTSTKTKADIILSYCDDSQPNNNECEKFLHSMEGEIVTDIE